MKALVLAAALTLAPTAQAEDNLIRGEGPGNALARIILVIPITLYVLGEFWTAACEGAGFEYRQGKDGFWECTGYPFKDA